MLTATKRVEGVLEIVKRCACLREVFGHAKVMWIKTHIEERGSHRLQLRGGPPEFFLGREELSLEGGQVSRLALLDWQRGDIRLPWNAHETDGGPDGEEDGQRCEDRQQGDTMLGPVQELVGIDSDVGQRSKHLDQQLPPVCQQGVVRGENENAQRMQGHPENEA